jgi:hypothetical protein
MLIMQDIPWPEHERRNKNSSESPETWVCKKNTGFSIDLWHLAEVERTDINNRQIVGVIGISSL